MENILESILSKLKEAANHCPSGTGKHDKIWLEDAEKIITDTFLQFQKQPAFPCNIGDTLYLIDEFVEGRESPELTEIKCNSITFSGFTEDNETIWDIDSYTFHQSDFGVIVFPSEKEAYTGVEAWQQTHNHPFTR